MQIPDWLGYKALRVFLLLNPLIYVAGLAISIWAWRATRKTGYIIVALYFVLAVLGKSFLPFLRVTSDSPRTVALTPQQQQEYTREMTATDKRYFPAGHPVTRTVVFPLGSLVLVAGLWVLAKRDVKHHAELTTSTTAAPSRPAA
ncbi:MAG TPA: hypothetical protein VL486_10040 [Verrucomicrobiae bacterium]|nr:hypothetical protein [Verrucomicrobiae bacterium]